MNDEQDEQGKVDGDETVTICVDEVESLANWWNGLSDKDKREVPVPVFALIQRLEEALEARHPPVYVEEGEQ